MKSPKTPACEKPLRECEPSVQALLFRQLGEEAKSGEALSAWCWCRCCEQAFPLGDVRVVPLADCLDEPFPTFACPVQVGEKPCPGEGADFRLWRQEEQPCKTHLEYPETPEPGQRYPLA
jgi:hypothetical protein